LIIVPAIILAGFSFFYSKEIMNLLYHEHTETSSQLLGLLMLGFVFVAATYIFGTLLTANGSMKQLNIMATFGMLFNIGINFYLIPQFMSIGAGYSSLLTQFITAIIQVFIAQSIFKFRINYSFLIRLLLFILVVIFLGFAVKEYIANWILGFFVFGTISLIFSIAIKLISVKSLIKIIKSEE
jgi:O-antigen/teichoic acid export membrane protein